MTRMRCDDKSLRRAEKVYGAFLRLYPREHRDAYGGLMRQLFRDQWQDSLRRGDGGGPARLAMATLADLIRSAFSEHLTQQAQNMNHAPWKKLSYILFAVAVLAGLFSCTTSVQNPQLAVALAYLSGLVLAARAVVEWNRPIAELFSSLVTGAAVAVIYALIMPVWGKVHLPVLPWLVVVPMLLNAFIPLVRAGMKLVKRQA